jgi:starch synthase
VLRVLHVSSEVAPFAQSGGLADVVAGLPEAQAALGVDPAVIVPLYHGVAAKLAAANIALVDAGPLAITVGPWQPPARLLVAHVGRVKYAFVEIPPLYDRPGGLYGPSGAAEFTDNQIRFGALGAAAVAAGPRLFGASPDILHVHDWQGGPAAMYARIANLPSAIVTTIHNLAYRGIFPKSTMTELGIPWSMFTAGQLEFYDQVSLLKAACAFADVVTTVSPTYAQEILTPERGEVLDGFLRSDVKRITGIVNGIDTTAWDPATDRALPARFSIKNLAGKAVCRRELAREIDLPLPDDEPLVGAIARMTGQKGLDLVCDIVPEIAAIGARLVVLGAGEEHLENRFRWLASTFDTHVRAVIGFDSAFARRIYAGCDLFLMPSRFEPCGLGQLYAMRYGTIPIASSVGGLRDTVRDLDEPSGGSTGGRAGGTGIRFEPVTAPELANALRRGAKLFRDPGALARTRRAAMSRDSSWNASAQQYLRLYRSLRT